MHFNLRHNLSRMLKSATAVLMAVAVLLLCLSPVSAKAGNEKIEALEARIREAEAARNEAQSRVNDSKEDLTTLNETATTLRGSLSNLNRELQNVSDNLSDIEGRITDKNTEISEMETELESAVEIEEAQYEAMKLRIKYMYEAQDYDILENFLGTSDFGEFLNKAEYFESITKYDRKMLEEYRHTKSVIEQAKALLEEERENLEFLRKTAEEEQSKVQTMVNKTSDSISAYEEEIDETEERMKAEEAALKVQQDNLAQLKHELEEEKRLTQLARQSAWRDISQVSFAPDDRKLLANIIYCEAGNQPYEGQVAVGAVIMNRVMSAVFPDTVVGVVYQRNQFSPVRSGRLALALAQDKATESCYRAADAAMSGQTTVGNCLFFRTPNASINGIVIGGHVFY